MDIKTINQGVANSRQSDAIKNQERAQSSQASSAGTQSTPTDKVTLTSVSTQLKDLELKANLSNVDNSARIEELKASIKDGSYQVNAEKVASKLIQTEVLFARA